jgi:16S rRNA (cytosine967-C5)-methyltransferase
MHPNALLDLETELLTWVLRFDQPADRVVSDFFRSERALGLRERHTMAETTYAVLRRRPLYQHLAQSGKGRMERRLAILGWQGNEGFLRAALSPDEQQWLERSKQVDIASLPDRLRHNLPDWLAEKLQASLGDDFWAFVAGIDA